MKLETIIKEKNQLVYFKEINQTLNEIINKSKIEYLKKYNGLLNYSIVITIYYFLNCFYILIFNHVFI